MYLMVNEFFRATNRDYSNDLDFKVFVEDAKAFAERLTVIRENASSSLLGTMASEAQRVLAKKFIIELTYMQKVIKAYITNILEEREEFMDFSDFIKHLYKEKSILRDINVAFLNLVKKGNNVYSTYAYEPRLFYSSMQQAAYRWYLFGKKTATLATLDDFINTVIIPFEEEGYKLTYKVIEEYDLIWSVLKNMQEFKTRNMVNLQDHISSVITYRNNYQRLMNCENKYWSNSSIDTIRCFMLDILSNLMYTAYLNTYFIDSAYLQYEDDVVGLIVESPIGNEFVFTAFSIDFVKVSEYRKLVEKIGISTFLANQRAGMRNESDFI